MIHFQKTKIVATVGPSSANYETLLGLVEAGVDVFRLNFSHGNHETHLKVIDHIDAINEKLGTHVGILADLQGPKLRVGEMENNGLDILRGDILTFVNERCIGTKDRVYMSYPFFAQDVKVGEKVMVDDGKVELEVVETNGKDTVKLKVLFGGRLLSKKGVNLPDTNVSQPSLTEKDLEDLAFILRQPSVNWIALSFVRRASDITELREHIRRAQHGAKIIAKIEKPEAIAVIDSIIAEADAIMVARGDLGVEMPIAELPLMQKDIVNRCVLAAKPVIVATQMMESMMENPSPTRPEVTDVANAMLDGCDAVMLSGETASGKHPILVVETMKRIIKTVEEKGNIYAKQHTPNSASRTYISDVVCYTACRTAADLKATTIIGMTKSGYTAFLVSSFRPNTDICIFSDNRHILNTLNLVWGVRSFFYDRFTTTDETIADVITILKKENIVKKGNIVINTGSMPLEARLRTNMLKVTEV